jgi:hypothetical protein
MSEQANRSTNFHALLIGIDKYLPNELPDGTYYKDLSGCVRDINHVEQFLRATLSVPADNIIKLTAPNNGGDDLVEPPDHWPTYENMVRGFQRLSDRSKPGDQVYIHYSGHGGRASTILPELKGEYGLDECLVPADIGDSEARYLRDIELVKLLRSLVKRDLLVTVVLDSCHSAGMSRGSDANIRGVGTVDTTARPKESLVASRDDLAAEWREVTKTVARNLSATPWLPGFQGMILLSACGPSELAFEYPFDGTESNGALTYWLLNSLAELGLNLTYKQLHDRIVAKVHSQFENQTPHLEGDGSRLVFGIDRVPSTYSAFVMEVGTDRERLLLNVGQVHGVRRGSEFAIYSIKATSLENRRQQLGVAKIENIGSTDSWADFIPSSGKRVEQGDQAVLINPGSIHLIRRVRLLDDTPTGSSAKRRTALDLVGKAIHASAWLELATDELPSEYQVAIDSIGRFEILDRTGVNLTIDEAAIVMDADDASLQVVRRLEHITKFQAVQEIDNHDTRSPLARKLSIEWVGYQKEFELGEKPDPTPFQNNDNVVTVQAGDWVFLRLRNLSEHVLNVTALNLQPDWGISQVHPIPPTAFVALDPNTEELVPLKTALPEGRSHVRDIMKVFGSLGTPNFRWLQLPTLDRGNAVAKRRFRGPEALDSLLDAFTESQPAMRNLTPAAYPSHEWTTGQVELRVTSKKKKEKR